MPNPAKAANILKFNNIQIDNGNPLFSFVADIKDSSVKYHLRFKYNSQIISNAGFNIDKQPVGKTTFNIPLTSAQVTAFLSLIGSTATQITISCELLTYDSSYSEQHGISIISAKVVLSQEYSGPIFSDYTYRDDNTNVTDVTGDNQRIIQNASDLVVSFSPATAKRNATITGYRIEIGSIQETYTLNVSNDYDVGAVLDYGTQKLSVTAIDSRGFETTITKTLDVTEYQQTALTEWQAERLIETGIESGEHVKLTFSGKVYPIIVNNTNLNPVPISLTAYLKYGTVSTSVTLDNTNGLTIDTSNNTFSYECNDIYTTFGELYSPDSSKNIRVYFNNVFSTLRLYADISVPKYTPTVSIRDGRIGINTLNPNVALDVIGDIHANGYDVFINKTYSSQTATADSVYSATDIPSTADLNNITNQGIYWTNGGTQTNHFPIDNSPGILEVLNIGSRLFQRYTRINTSPGSGDVVTTVYIRGAIIHTSDLSIDWGGWNAL